MILGLISVLLDFLFLNIFNYSPYNTLFFPMFTITYLLGTIYFRKDIKVQLFVILLYVSLTGIIFYLFFFYLLSFYFIRKDKRKFNKKDYLVKIMLFLLLFDVLLFLQIYLFSINIYSLSILFHKLIISLPLNYFYSLIIYGVLNIRKYKYKLV